MNVMLRMTGAAVAPALAAATVTGPHFESIVLAGGGRLVVQPGAKQ